MDIETYALCKKYTDEEVLGGGAIKGKNCVVTEIEDIPGGHRVHFQWTLDDGTVETDTMTVMDGEDGTVVSASETNGNIVIDGTETQVYDDSELQGIVSTDETTIEGNPINFSTLSAQTVQSTIIDLEPIQDLHGYNYPWVGGAGKNQYDISSATIPTNTVKTSTGFIMTSIVQTRPIVRYTLNKTFSSDTPVVFSFNVDAISGETSQNMFSGFIIKKTDNTNRYVGIPKADLITTGYKTIYAMIDAGETLVNVDINVNDTVNILTTGISITVSNIQLEYGTSTATSFAPYENICPISGRTEIGILGCGKNLFDGTYVNAYLENGSTWKSNANCRSAIVPVSGNTKYTIKKYGGNRFSICESDSLPVYNTAYNTLYNQDAGTEATVTTSNGMKYLLIYVDNSSTEPNMQVEVGQTATQYEPYTLSNSLTISLGQTVYGARHDVGRGLLVADKVIYDLGNLNWTYDSTYQRFESSNIPNKKQAEYARAENFPCSCYKTIYDRTPISDITTGSIYSYDYLVYVHDTRYTDATTFKSAVTGQTICYEIATPITIELTPHQIALLEGVNNISTDGDKITLTYRDGKVATLGDLTSAVDELDGKIEDSQILTDTVTGDKYKLVVTSGVLSIEQISN